MGTFLYYVRISNPTMLVTLNIIAAYHEKIAQATEKKVVKILNYVANHPEEITCYHTSGMILHIHSDAYFLSVLGSNIRAGGYHYLSSPFTKPNPPPPPHTLSTQLTHTRGMHHNE